ncbi:MAG: Rpn family recombination-promoting nuclease/putative transposase [Acidobacteriota bacterium]|nr:Rpn family recombination-promoting nuclease/putative transposase [Acidobacteriota bacterium]
MSADDSCRPPRKIDPCVDYAFIRIMSDPEILLDFISRVFEEQEVEVSEVTIQNRDIAEDKLSIADVQAIDDQGRIVQIEIQLIVDRFLRPRILFTWALNYTKSITKGMEYAELKPTFSIWVLGEKMVDDDHPHHHFSLYDKKRDVTLTDHLGIHTLELPKCPPRRRIETGLDRWIYFLEHGREFDPWNPPEVLKTTVMQKVFKVLQEISQEEKDYLNYRRRLDVQMLTGSRQKHERQLQEKLKIAEQRNAELMEALRKNADELPDEILKLL